MEEDTDGLAAGPRHQFLLNRLLGDQTDSPSRLAFGRVAANHRDNTLLFRWTQQRSRARPRLFVKGSIQPAFLITVGD